MILHSSSCNRFFAFLHHDLTVKLGATLNRLVRWTDNNVVVQKDDDPMINLNFSSLYRVTVGFDQIAHLMNRVPAATDASMACPPNNIKKMQMMLAVFPLLPRNFRRMKVPLT